MSTHAGYGIYALRYAYRHAQAYEHFYRSACEHDQMDMAYYTWLLVSDAAVIAVDAGFTAAMAVEKNREYVASPIETMAELGIVPADVSTLVLTHFHYDHTGHVDQFPNATIVAQQAEMRFWTGPDVHYGEHPFLVSGHDLSVVVDANFAGRVQWVDGDGVITPGVSVHLVGGHTPGLQVVLVETATGPVLLASDASHFYANVEQNRPYSIAHTIPTMYRAFDRMRDLAGPTGVIIPGHDPEVIARYPVAAPGLAGRAVRIA